MKAAMIFALGAMLVPASATGSTAQDALPACELHVWPTRTFTAYSHDPDFVAALTGNYAGRLSPHEAMQHVLGETASEEMQRIAVEELNLGTQGRFAGYQIIFHPAPADPGVWDVTNPNLGAGGRRRITSSSPCYAELHIHFMTWFRDTFTKRIQTTFMFRDFGGSGTTFRWAYDITSTSAPGFPARSPELQTQARLGLMAAVKQNIRDFLNSRAMRPERLRPRR